MSRDHCIVYYKGQDVTGETATRDGRANPFGWSSYRFVHIRREGMAEIEIDIGRIESGYPTITDPDYSCEVIPEERLPQWYRDKYPEAL